MNQFIFPPTDQGRAQRALAERLAEVIAAEGAPCQLDDKGYLADEQGHVPPDGRPLARFNVVRTVGDDDLDHALTQVGGGAGNELQGDDGRRPKFLAAYSSAALALNVFAPFLRNGLVRVDEIDLAGSSLEHILSIGSGCGRPNLDLLVKSDERVLAVESKCTEYLKTKAAKARDGDFETLSKRKTGDPYRARLEALADGDGPLELYELLANDHSTFKHLDATQLLKHYMGLRNSHEATRCTLLYVYWEPQNSAELDACRLHVNEIETFSEYMTGSWITFRAQTYEELWRAWAQSGGQLIQDHVAALRRRYDVSA